MLEVIAALLAATGSLASADAAGPRDPLRFCLAAHNLPFSTSHPPWGIDGELAQAVGRSIGREAEFVWISEEEESPEEALLGGRCDAAMGAITDEGSLARHSSAPGLALTVPYYTAGYMLIQAPAAASPVRLSDVGDGRIAVEMVSIPIYTLKQRGRSVYAVDDTEAVVDAVAAGKAPYGYLWGPVGAWLLRNRSDVLMSPTFEPVEKWSFAIAVREGDEELRARLDETLANIVASGEAERLFGKYGIPYIPPTPPPPKGGSRT